MNSSFGIVNVEVIFDNSNKSTLIGPALQKLMQSKCVPLFGIYMQFFTLSTAKVSTDCVNIALKIAGIRLAIPDFRLQERIFTVEHIIRYADYFARPQKVFRIFVKTVDEELLSLRNYTDKFNVSLPNICNMRCDMAAVLPDGNFGKKKGSGTGILSKLNSAKEFAQNTIPAVISKLSPSVRSVVDSQISSLAPKFEDSIVKKISPSTSTTTSNQVLNL